MQPDEMHRNSERAAEQLLVGGADDAGLERAERRVAFGFAAHASHVAEEEAAELIVVGARGRGAFNPAD